MEVETLNPEPTAAPRHELPSCRGLVLIVDDEDENRLLLRDPLEALGYEITEAANGAQALQSISHYPPDTILLDIMMPRMDGFEVCRRVKKDARTASIPILMVTALSDRQQRLMGIAAGANDFLTKPVDVQDVMLRVGNATSAKHLSDQLLAEREKSEQLLRNILPEPIAERMKKGELNIADHHPDATVLVADLVGFTTLSFHIGPIPVVLFLNEIFSAFDDLTEKYGLEKIKTIGDAYMVAGGLPLPRPDHARAIAELALDMQAEIGKLSHEYSTPIHLRIGISTGPVVAGVIGRKKFAYDLWGDAVNLACRLESIADAGSIMVAASTYLRLKDLFQFQAKPETALDCEENTQKG
jgi:class 3 adenylate cyclase